MSLLIDRVRAETMHTKMKVNRAAEAEAEINSILSGPDSDLKGGLLQALRRINSAADVGRASVLIGAGLDDVAMLLRRAGFVAVPLGGNWSVNWTGEHSPAENEREWAEYFGDVPAPRGDWYFDGFPEEGDE